ncbi:MAG: gliding motility-associated C-terminal domain-containing protein [Saprospiraceae bacterium]|nr:gliding motility-associated C-terminal domain-containing protein [Saprospiraceae bacterium]
MSSRIIIFFIVLLLGVSLHAQIYVVLKSPQGINPCQGLPIEIRVINEGKNVITNSNLQFLKGSHLTYRQGSLSGDSIQIINSKDPKGPLFRIDRLDICESLTFNFWMDHGCASEIHADSFKAELYLNNRVIESEIQNIKIFSPKISIISLKLVYDETKSTFQKRFSIVNIGELALDSFSLYISGNDKMSILNSNYGILSLNGDTLNFNQKDFTGIGNGNQFFERGESIEIIQEINLNACETDFHITHKLNLPCNKSACEFIIDDNIKLQAIVGTPKLNYLLDSQIIASPCVDGIVKLQLLNFSNNGSFNLGNSLFNLYLNLGWSILQGNQLTEPLRDNCLRIIEARLNGKIVPIITTAFSGYGLDFRKYVSDPDGPGGLDDLDNDGYYDDLGPKDTLRLTLKYDMDPNCLRIGCDQVVFDWRILRIKGEYNNYCGVNGSIDRFVSEQSYQWTRPAVYTGGLKDVYYNQETDTVSFVVNRNEKNILNYCNMDSSSVRIILPPVTDLLPGAEILVNGLPVIYRRSGNLIFFETKNSNFNVLLPLKFICDPNLGSGGVNTPCTSCAGSGTPKYNLRIEVDYYCGDQCFQKIPLYCGNSSAFAAICSPSGGGAGTSGKLTIEKIEFKRLTTGYKDSSHQSKVNPNVDSINHNSFFTYDTFLIHIPFDILCDASFSNIYFRLAYLAKLFYVAPNQYDTFHDIRWISDTLKFFDGETNRWSYCSSALGQEFYSSNPNIFYSNFLRELDISSKFSNCLLGSLSSSDSMVFVIKAAIPFFENTQFSRNTLTAELTYNQDGCNMKQRESEQMSIFTGKPYPGNITLRQDYSGVPDFTKFSPYLSVCGNFRIETVLDNYGFYSENADPFLNEYRNTYLVENLKVVIPPFFMYQNNIPNYVRITRKTQSSDLQYDTSYISPSVRDSSGYTILEFDKFNDKEDFEMVQHLFYFYVRPDCYVNQIDTIRIHKKFKYLRHLQDSSLYKDLYSVENFLVNTATTDLIFSEKQKQILRDTIVSWKFGITSKSKTSVPKRFFTYKHLWVSFDNPTGNILIDSLVEYDTLGNPTYHLPKILSSGKRVYELDSLYDERKFELFTHFNSCNKDSIIVLSGNSCSSYPSDYDFLTGKCRDYVDQQVLIYEPEESAIRLDLISQPIDSLSQPCDSFKYSVEVYNSGLGHSFNNRFYFSAPKGMILKEAWLEYPKDSFTLLSLPITSPQAGTYFWELNPIIFPNGLTGFYRIDESYFKIHFTFDGNCELEDGQSISFYLVSSNVCNQEQRSQVVNSKPFRFVRNTQNQQDLYNIHLSFSADSACGDFFKARCVLYSKNDSINRFKQNLYFIYAKELSFKPGTFKAIKNVNGSKVRFYYLDGIESLEIPFSGPIPKGDSVVFELELERTCIVLCKTTDFKLHLNSEQSVECSRSSGGQCAQLLQIQDWEFKDVELSPRLSIEDSELNAKVLPGGLENLNVKYLIENKSPFAGKIDYKIKFYFDQNGNGLLDSTDILTRTDTINGIDVNGFSKSWHEWNHVVSGIHSCRLIAVIEPADNPCLCTADTLGLKPPIINGESKKFRICYDQKLYIGFDSIQGYIFRWLQADRLDSVNKPYAQYHYPLNLSAGTELKDTLFLLVSKEKSCFYYDTVFMELYRPDAELLQIDSIRCFGEQSASLRALGFFYSGELNYEWQGRLEKSPEIKNLGPGWYKIKVTDSLKCSAFDSILIIEPPVLNSNLTVITNYNGYSVSCNGYHDGGVKVQVQGGTPDYIYQWSVNRNARDTISGLEAGWIRVKVLDKNLCPAEDSILLNQPPPLWLTSTTFPAGCIDQKSGGAEVKITGGVPTYHYLWNTGDSTDNIRNINSGTYTVEVTDANGCKVDAELKVDQLSNPQISLSIQDTIIEFGSTLRLYSLTNVNFPKYHWISDEKISCDTCSSVTINPTKDQTITLIVIDENGCTAEAKMNIHVLISKEVWTPNVFSPNSDLVNDHFTIYGKPSLINIDRLQIFNRWGELLYEDYNLPPNDSSFGWNGTFRNKPVNPGVFVFVAQVKFSDGEIRQLSGDVTLIR